MASLRFLKAPLDKLPVPLSFDLERIRRSVAATAGLLGYDRDMESTALEMGPVSFPIDIWSVAWMFLKYGGATLGVFILFSLPSVLGVLCDRLRHAR